MSEVLIANLDEGMMQRLRERAARSGQSVEAEAAYILTEALRRSPPPGENPWAAVQEIHDRLAASGRTFSDSTEIIREIRSR